VSYGVTLFACNVGSVRVNMISTTNQHPVYTTNLYRLASVQGAGRFEQIGMSWAEHKSSLNPPTVSVASPCCNCSPFSPPLAPGCHVIIGAGNQSTLGPRSEINAATGQFAFPYLLGWNQSGNGIFKRLQIRQADIPPSSASGNLYFAEVQCVAADDAIAGNKINNFSFRALVSYPYIGAPSASGNFLAWAPGSVTQPTKPAIQAWQDTDPAVQIAHVDIPNDGRLIVAWRVSQSGPDLYHYEYAIQNLTSDRSVQGFFVPSALLPGVATSGIGFHDIDYHSGEPYSPTDWAATLSATGLNWETQTFAENVNANALRWGTLYNFRFDSTVPPAPNLVDTTIRLFKPGEPAFVTVPVQAPDAVDCNNNGSRDSLDIAQNISQDCNGNSIPDECELTTSDCNLNGLPDDCELTPASDCNLNAVLDVCELATHDCNHDGLIDECQLTPDNDCNDNGVLDSCELITLDCNQDGLIDACQLTFANDCNNNAILDVCELASHDCNLNGLPDNCELSIVTDCNGNSILDACETGFPDCNNNGIIDSCELSGRDCDSNGVPDECQLVGNDCDGNGVPDHCQADCDHNGVIDACEILAGAPDCNLDTIPDSCELHLPPPPTASPGLPIPDNHTGGVVSVIHYTGGGSVIDVNVGVNIPHTAVSHLKITLSHDGTSVIVWSNRCGNFDDLNVTFDDAGAFIDCLDLSATYRPNSTGGTPLSAFHGGPAEGDWTLTVADVAAGDTGTFASWTLDVTSTIPPVPLLADANQDGIPDTCQCDLPGLPDGNGNGEADACECLNCKGDGNRDGHINGRDIAILTQCLTGGLLVRCVDMDGNNVIDAADLTAFIDVALVANPPCVP